MNTLNLLNSRLVRGLFSACIAAAAFATASAHEAHNKGKAKAGEHAGMVMPADSDQAVAAYPLANCVVSGDKLEDGDMGPPINHVFKKEGKDDRLVRLCCKSCVKDFNEDPEKFLSMIDEAVAAKTKGEKPKEAAPSGHGNH